MNGTRNLYVLLLVLGLGLTAVFVAWPLFSRGPRLNRDLRDLTAKQDTLAKRLDQYQERQKEYENLVRLFGPSLRDPSTRMPRFVSQLQGLCGGSRMVVTSIQPLAREESEEGWVRFPVQLTVRGDLSGLIKLLFRLRNHVPLTDVERLTVRADAKNRRDLTIQMLLSSYGLLAEEILAERKQQQTKAEPRSARKRSTSPAKER
jgi:hypothetical protein